MGEIVAQAGSLREFVVFDSPAGVTFADASLLASYVKNVVIVHAAGKAPRGAESEFRNKLDVVGANIVGAVLNRVHPEDSHAYFQYRRFYEDLTVEDRERAAVPGGVRAIPPGGNGPGESGGNKQ
jgi:Mrp family chromosome partitioning ATPase